MTGDVNMTAAVNPASGGAPKYSCKPRVLWPDVVRVIATMAIFGFHYVGALPEDAGPLAADVIRNSGGPFAISTFIMLGGFTFALADSRPKTRAYSAALFERFRRLLVPYWVVAVPYLALGAFMHEFPLSELWKAPFWLSGLNILSPTVYLPPSESWWYVTLVLQMAIVAPLLPWARKSLGPLGLALAAVVLNGLTLLLVRSLPGAWLYLDEGFVFARIAEIVVGYLVGAAVFSGRSRPLDWRTVTAVVVLALGAIVIRPFGLWTSPAAFVAAALLVTACAALFGARTTAGRLTAGLATVSALSYAFYLSHSPIVRLFVRVGDPSSTTAALAWAVPALAASIGAAWLFDKAAALAMRPRVKRARPAESD